MCENNFPLLHITHENLGSPWCHKFSHLYINKKAKKILVSFEVLYLSHFLEQKESKNMLTTFTYLKVKTDENIFSAFAYYMQKFEKSLMS